MAQISVEHRSGETAYNHYGHSFTTVDDATEYLRVNGGGTISIVPDDWGFEGAIYQRNFDYDCDTEVLIVVEAEDDAQTEAELAAIITAGQAVEDYGLSESAVRQAINRGNIRARKSGGTWLIRRVDADKLWG